MVVRTVWKAGFLERIIITQDDWVRTIWDLEGMDLPLISVVIPVYNSASYLGGAIRSVLDQTYSNVEIIVVDDGSTDGSGDVTSSFGNRVRYVRQDNMGACAARNYGIRLAKGSYIAFLDADDLWLPEKLTEQSAVLEAKPKFGAVHCGTTRMNETGTQLSGNTSGLKQRVNGDVFVEFFESNISVILTSTVLVRKSCFESIGMFDGSGAVVDDHDFFLRLAAHYPIWFIAEALVRYRIIPRSLSRLRAVQRIEQHRKTIERAITAYPKFFADKRPRYLKRRWRSFHAWAGMMLYYQREYRAARGYLQKAFLSSPRILPCCLLTYLRAASKEDVQRSCDMDGRM